MEAIEVRVMSPAYRRWRCPECHREYDIPVTVEEPMACVECAGGADPAGIWRPVAGPPERAREESEVRSQGAGVRSQEAVGSRQEAAGGQRTTDQSSIVSRQSTIQTPLNTRGGRLRRPAAGLVIAIAAVGAVVAAHGLGWVEVPGLAELGLGPADEGATKVRESGTLFAGEPVVRANPQEDAPLVALIDFDTHVPAAASIQIDDGERQWTYRPTRPPEREHRLAVVGLRPGRTHRFRIRVESSEPEFSDFRGPFELTTPPLPDDFPPLRTLISRPERMEPGVTLFAVNLWWNGERMKAYGYVIALDEHGEVVWYYRSDSRTSEVKLFRGGHLFFIHANYARIFEVDLLGNTLRRWYGTGLAETDDEPPGDEEIIPIAADMLHHELVELPSGNILTLATELREIEGFPSSETDPQAPPERAYVVGDMAVEFQRDGTVVNRWKLLDILDPYRIGYGSLSGFWKKLYDHHVGAPSRDWSHANALCYEPQSDSIIVCVRHQDCLVKLDRKTGNIIWILGVHDGWRDPWRKYLLQPRGELQWPYHPHGPQLTPAGTILLYDNGNYRALPFEPKTPASMNYSRVVEFKVDEENMTVEQLWEYRGPPDEPFYSPFYGEADLLERTGNILITDGGRIEAADGTPDDKVPSAHQWARIVEVTRGEREEKVFEVVIDSSLGDPRGWSVNRSQRLGDVQSLSDLATASRRGG